MKNKKLKLAFLISVLLLAHVFYSCKKDDEFFEKAKSAQNMDRRLDRINKRGMDRYYNYVFDSIYNEEVQKIQKQIGGKLPNETRSIFQDELDIKSVENKNSLSTTMDGEILSTGQTILTVYQKKIVDEMNKYGLDISNTNIQRYFVANDVKDLLFIGVGAQFDEDVYQIGKTVFGNLSRDINDFIDKSNCNISDKQHLKSKISQILQEMERSLIANRKSIEQKYSDFYLLNDFGQMSLGLTQYNNTTAGSYKMLDWLNCKYLITTQSVNVYTTNIPISFLQDSTASYKLISVAPNQWQIMKKQKNGQEFFSDIFFDNQDFTRDIEVSDTPKNIGSAGFSYTHDGHGIVINFYEIVDVNQRKKDWPSMMSGADKQITDSLSQEIERKRKMDIALNRAWSRSDSIARILTLQHFDSINGLNR